MGRFGKEQGLGLLETWRHPFCYLVDRGAPVRQGVLRRDATRTATRPSAAEPALDASWSCARTPR
eukprot:8639358-Alexandrium_andersonii.AAC.1